MAKKKFSRDLILEVAYELSFKHGLDGINMRMIAREIGCSVMPIYESFSSKEDLLDALSTFNEKAYDLESNTMQDRYYKLLEDGLKYPKFFASVLKHDVNFQHEEEVLENIIKLIKKDVRLRRLSDRDIFILNSRIEVFIIGLVFTYQMVDKRNDPFGTAKRILDEGINAFIDHCLKTH
jgi:AcrR family transcriptional regulator